MARANDQDMAAAIAAWDELKMTLHQAALILEKQTAVLELLATSVHPHGKPGSWIEYESKNGKLVAKVKP